MFILHSTGHGDSGDGEGGVRRGDEGSLPVAHAQQGEAIFVMCICSVIYEPTIADCGVLCCAQGFPFDSVFCECLQVSVEVLSVIRVEEEIPTAYSGDNIKLKLKGVEEEVCVQMSAMNKNY